MAEKKKKSETRIAFEKKFKAERKKQGAGGTFMFRGKKYTTDYASEKKSKKKKESGAVEKSSPPPKRPKIIEEKLPPGNRTDGEPIKRTELPKFRNPSKPSKEATERKNVPTVTETAKKPIKVTPAPPRPRLSDFKGSLNPNDPFRMAQKKRREWLDKYGDDYNLDGTLKKNKQPLKRGDRRFSMGGVMPTEQRQINPSTGLAMKKGGMMDMRKTGMFYGGGMARKR